MVEFVTAGVLLLVPVAYLVIVLGRLQAAAFAADGSARAAGRAFVTAADEESGRRLAAASVRLGLRDQGFPGPADGRMELSCPAPGDCLEPGTAVTVVVEVRVRLPGVPAFVDRAVPTAVDVRATHVAVVDEFRAPGGGDDP